MNAATLDQYPSTYDLPLIAGGQDAVLATLEGTRKRYARSMSTEDYIAPNGSVCAVGAVAREDGLKHVDYEAFDAETGEVKVYYKGSCSDCGLHVELKASKRFWP